MTTTLKHLLQQTQADLQRQRPSPEQDAAVLLQLQRQLQAQAQAQLQGQGELAAAGGMSLNANGPGWLKASGALLTLLALAFAFSLLHLEPKPVVAPVASAYLPLVSQEEWQQAQAGGEPVWIVPTEMPRERLALLGLPYDTARAADTVRAEVMVHRSGQVLAVRFVQ